MVGEDYPSPADTGRLMYAVREAADRLDLLRYMRVPYIPPMECGVIDQDEGTITFPEPIQTATFRSDVEVRAVEPTRVDVRVTWEPTDVGTIPNDFIQETRRAWSRMYTERLDRELTRALEGGRNDMATYTTTASTTCGDTSGYYAYPTGMWTSGGSTTDGTTYYTTSSTSTEWVSYTWQPPRIEWNFLGDINVDYRQGQLEGNWEEVNERVQAEHEERRLKAEEAEQRAEELLLETLSEEHREEYQEHGCVTVAVGKVKYRLKKGRTYNVQRLDGKGKAVEKLCCHVGQQVPDADNMAAQYLHLTHDPEHFLSLANKMRA